MYDNNFLNNIFTAVKDYMVFHGYSETSSERISLAANIIGTILFIYLLDLFLRKVIVRGFLLFTDKTKTTFDDFLAKSNFPKYVAHIIPFVVMRLCIPYILDNYPDWKNLLLKATDIYLIILIVWIFRSVVRSIKEYLKEKEAFRDKPLDSYAQVIILFLWLVGLLFMFSEVTGQSILKFLATLGAASAVLLLIFRDTILGFVASIQVSVNDMVRIGDWITMEKYGADGDVIEINLTTVKVQNFDNTITTIPTYALISDSFKNWRGMVDSGGRRIKRAVFIKSASVRFLTKDDLLRYSKIQAIQQYIDHRQKDIEAFNTQHGYDKSLLVNGRNQTNLGLFRKYTDIYLQNHPAVNKEMMIMTRHLAPTSQGIPLEIYVFSKDKRWENYEHIMADIFEHIIAAIPYFDLEVFEYPAGTDLKKLFSN